MSLTRWRVCAILQVVLMAAGPSGMAGDQPDLVSPPVDVRLKVVPSSPLTGPRLPQTLADRVPGATWANAPVRRVVHQISESYALAILCDRRLDPTVPVDVNAVALPVRDVLDEVARDAGGEVRRVGNVVYLAPAETATIVRTVVALRQQELAGVTSRRAAALSRSRSIGWRDLTPPAEIVGRIADGFDLTVENLDRIPHDLWAGSVLPEMDAAQMLTLVLIQFDLTFAWSADATSIRLVPLPEDTSTIRIERTYPSFRKIDAALSEWKTATGVLDVQPKGQQVVVRGPLELHELIEQVQNGRTKPRPRSQKGGIEGVPLARREFTLTVSRIPASAIISKLEESGIAFEYDAAALTAAGIDLNTPVSLEVERADAETFFKTIFDPLGLAVELDGVTVTLRPASRNDGKEP